MNKLKEWSGVACLVLLLLAIFMPSGQKLGNATASYQDAAQGFRVNGTEVISSAAVVDAPSINVAGSITGGAITGATTTLGATHTGAFVEGGTGVTVTATATLTAAQVCTTNPFTIANTTDTITVTFPSATSTNANCLTTDGDFTRFWVLNNSTNTVLFATSTGNTMASSFNASTTKNTLSNSTGSYPNASVTLIRVNSTTDAYFISQFGQSL